MINQKINTGLLLKVILTAVTCIVILILIESRGRPANYFSTRCIDYNQKEFSRQLNDKITDYSSAAKRGGIGASSTDKEFKQKISDGLLVKVRSGSLYVVDRLTFSYPVVTSDSKILLDEIARRFRDKASQKGLTDARFYITSMTRKTGDLKNLRRFNSNTSANSPHLYGNAFDISYKRFSVRKLILTNCDKRFLKESLAEAISQLRDENKCWATYERMQNCFHVVSR